jgi:hypothetical protein
LVDLAAIVSFAKSSGGIRKKRRFSYTLKGQTAGTNREAGRDSAAVKNVISMDEHLKKGESRIMPVRDRRYAIRHPFAADAEFIDLETGNSGGGVTSDLSMGGCFVCTSKPLALNSRVKLKLMRKDQIVETLAVVRIVKPRIGMGIEFLDVEERHHSTLERWMDQLRRDR